MGDDGKASGAGFVTDEAHRPLELGAGVLGTAEGGVRVGHFFHLGIAIGMAEALKIEAPNIKTGCAQRIAPRNAIEPVSDGEARWKGRAVYIEHREYGARAASRGRRRRQTTQEQSQARAWACDPVMLFSGIQPGRSLLQHQVLLNRPTSLGFYGFAMRCRSMRTRVIATEFREAPSQ